MVGGWQGPAQPVTRGRVPGRSSRYPSPASWAYASTTIGPGDAQLAGEISGGGKPGAGAEGRVPDGMAELVLDLAAEGPGALPVYGDEDVEWAGGHVVTASVVNKLVKYFYSVTGSSPLTSLLLLSLYVNRAGPGTPSISRSAHSRGAGRGPATRRLGRLA